MPIPVCVWAGHPLTQLSARASPSYERDTLILAAGTEHGSKFCETPTGWWLGGLHTMMSSEPKSVVRMACSPLLHYAFRVAKLRRRHKTVSKPYNRGVPGARLHGTSTCTSATIIIKPPRAPAARAGRCLGCVPLPGMVGYGATVPRFRGGRSVPPAAQCSVILQG